VISARGQHPRIAAALRPWVSSSLTVVT